MTNSRLFTSYRPGIAESAVTLFRDERTFEGDWSHPNVALLIFKDSKFTSGSASPHGGPVGSGLPVQLVFWGDWWNGQDGADRANMIQDRVERAIRSPYFSELAQYGVSSPRFRGRTIVTRPPAPTHFGSDADVQSVRDLIDSLIDDDVFPDPDDEKIAFIVLMPQGFTGSMGANGSHTWDYNYEFPFDKDWYWVAWVRYWGPGIEPGDEDPENTIRSLSHELVEMLTDPEGDGWYNDSVRADDREIGDAAWSGSVRQAAWVNGARVTAYWSNAHGATVIPIDRDYAARTVGDIDVEHTHEIDSGTFRPDPAERVLCGHVDVCCIEDRDYSWTIVGRDEIVSLRLETHRYRSPTAAWTVNGIAIAGSGTAAVPVSASRYHARMLESADETVSVEYEATTAGLTLRTSHTDVNFDLEVGCAVHDASITGTLAVDVIATPSVTVGFVGSELVLDPDYERQRAACAAWIAARYEELKHKARFHTPKPGEPVEIDPGVLVEMPAWTRMRLFGRARRAILLADMGRHALPHDVADAFTPSLLEDAPELADAVRSSGATVGVRTRD